MLTFEATLRAGSMVIVKHLIPAPFFRVDQRLGILFAGYRYIPPKIGRDSSTGYRLLRERRSFPQLEQSVGSSCGTTPGLLDCRSPKQFETP